MLVAFADAIDPTAQAIKSLLDHWPWLSVLIAGGTWLARSVLIPLTNRHTSFLDALESRERERLQNDVQMSAALTGISTKLVEQSSDLREIKDCVKVPHCKAREVVAQHILDKMGGATS